MNVRVRVRAIQSQVVFSLFACTSKLEFATMDLTLAVEFYCSCRGFSAHSLFSRTRHFVGTPPESGPHRIHIRDVPRCQNCGSSTKLASCFTFESMVARGHYVGTEDVRVSVISSGRSGGRKRPGEDSMCQPIPSKRRSSEMFLPFWNNSPYTFDGVEFEY